ncbi:MAG: hypothetical protein SFW63_02195 [Alphaproteobacteria bacterium]|nr:hypothetical protein [Alphaproteobacteria bacterium]
MQLIPDNLYTSQISSSGARDTIHNRATSADFDDFLSSAGKRLNITELAIRIQETISITINQTLNTLGSKPGAGRNVFAFTSSFTDVFGDSGPLINFINDVTRKLWLNADQNRALQQIAVNNKDATRSPESIAKIAAELRQAGITA